MKFARLLALIFSLSLLTSCVAGINPGESPTPPVPPPTPGAINVMNVGPSDGSIVALDSQVTIDFDKPVNPSSISSITISDASGNGVALAASLSDADTVLLTPQANFAANTMYTVSISGVQGSNGETMENKYESSFWTPDLGNFESAAATAGFNNVLPYGSDQAIVAGFKISADGRKIARTAIYDDSGNLIREATKDDAAYVSLEVVKAVFRDNVLYELIAAAFPLGVNEYYVIEYDATDLSEKAYIKIDTSKLVMRDIRADSSGNAIVCGFRSTDGGAEGALAKCSAAGCEVHTSGLGELGRNLGFRSCSLDSNDDIYVVGYNSLAVHETKSTVAKYNDSLVVQSYADTADGIILQGIDVKNNEIVVAGTSFNAAGTEQDLLIAKIDISTLAISQSAVGNATYKHPPEAGYVNVFNSVAISGSDIYATGSRSTVAEATSYEAYTVKYDSTLSSQASYVSQAAPLTRNAGVSIVADGASGRVFNTVDLDSHASYRAIISDMDLNCAAGPCS